MRAVDLKVLKNKLSEYIRLAARGETVLVTDHDRVVAEITPPAAGRAERLADAQLAALLRDGLLRRLKARAAIEGMSMSDYVLRELRKALDRPTRQEVLDRLRSRPQHRLRRAAADVIRAERDSR